MTEADIQAFYQQPWVMVASDGGIGIGGSHPRGAGTFPPVLGVFVREKQWLPASRTRTRTWNRSIGDCAMSA